MLKTFGPALLLALGLAISDGTGGQPGCIGDQNGAIVRGRAGWL
jgi:hypothetical protein